MEDKYEELVELAKSKGLSGKENVDLYLSLGMPYKKIRSRINQNTTGHILENKDGFKGTLFDYSKLHGFSVSAIKQQLKKFDYDIDKIIEHLKEVNSDYLEFEYKGNQYKFKSLDDVLAYLNINLYQWRSRYKKNKNKVNNFIDIYENGVSMMKEFEFRGEKGYKNYFIKKYKLPSTTKIDSNEDLEKIVLEMEDFRYKRDNVFTKDGDVINRKILEEKGINISRAKTQSNRGWTKEEILNQERFVKKNHKAFRNNKIEFQEETLYLKDLKKILNCNDKYILEIFECKSSIEFYKLVYPAFKLVKDNLDLKYKSMYEFCKRYNILFNLDKHPVEIVEEIKENSDEFLSKLNNLSDIARGYLSGDYTLDKYRLSIKNNEKPKIDKDKEPKPEVKIFTYDGKTFSNKTALFRYIGVKSFDVKDKNYFRRFTTYDGRDIPLYKFLRDLSLSATTVSSLIKSENSVLINSYIVLYELKDFYFKNKKYKDFFELIKEYPNAKMFFRRKNYKDISKDLERDFNKDSLLEALFKYLSEVKDVISKGHLYSFIDVNGNKFESNNQDEVFLNFVNYSKNRIIKYLKENDMDLQKFYDEEYKPSRIYKDDNGVYHTVKNIKDFVDKYNLSSSKVKRYSDKTLQFYYDNREKFKMSGYTEQIVRYNNNKVSLYSNTDFIKFMETQNFELNPSVVSNWTKHKGMSYQEIYDGLKSGELKYNKVEKDYVFGKEFSSKRAVTKFYELSETERKIYNRFKIVEDKEKYITEIKKEKGEILYQNKFINLEEFCKLNLNLKFDPETSFKLILGGIELEKLLKD